MTIENLESEWDIVAYHEAGHAIMAMACDFELTAISIDTEKVGEGFTGFNVRGVLAGDIARKAALVSVSGLAADMLFAKKTNKARLHEELSGHYNDQKNFHRYICLSGTTGGINDYIVVSMMFLESNWERLSSLAETLKIASTINAQALDPATFPRLPEDWGRLLDCAAALNNATNR